MASLMVKQSTGQERGAALAKNKKKKLSRDATGTRLTRDQLKQGGPGSPSSSPSPSSASPSTSASAQPSGNCSAQASGSGAKTGPAPVPSPLPARKEDEPREKTTLERIEEALVRKAI